MLEIVAFYVLSLLLVCGVFSVVIMSHPVYQVLLLIFSFFNVAGLLILLNAEFLAMTIIIIYVGAVALLFLFIMMLVDIKSIPKKRFSKYMIFTFILTFILGVELVLVIFSGINEFVIHNQAQDVTLKMSPNYLQAFGELLFNNYYYMILIVAILLTITAVGAVNIVKGDYTVTAKKTQDSYLQNLRSTEKSVYTVKIEQEKGLKS